MQELTIFRPIQVSDEARVPLAHAFFTEARQIIDINYVVVAAHCQKFPIW